MRERRRAIQEQPKDKTGTKNGSKTGKAPAVQRPALYKRKVSINFYPLPSATDKQGWCPVRIMVRWHGQEMPLDTGERIMATKPGKRGQPVSLWEAQRVTKDHPGYLDINGRLSEWERDVTKAFETLWDAAPFERISREDFFAYLFPAVEVADRAQATQSWRQLLDTWKEKNRHLAASSLRKYDQMATEMEKWNPELRPAQMTEDIGKDYLNHLLDLGQSDATIKVHFTGIRKCLERLGRPTDAAWLQYSAKNAPQLDLEIKEVRQLILWRPSEAHLAEERDRWLFQLFSGRRYEDLEKFDAARQRISLTLEDGTQVPALAHVQGKTGNDAAVPLPPIAVAIGERWGWKFPARTWQQRCDYIKEVARAAGLVREWDDRLITGGKVVHNWRPVWQVISTHTARHTAATLLKQVSKGNKALAKLVLGHADEDVTDRYAKDKAQLLAPDVLAAWQAILGELYDQAPQQ